MLRIKGIFISFITIMLISSMSSSSAQENLIVPASDIYIIDQTGSKVYTIEIGDIITFKAKIYNNGTSPSPPLDVAFALVGGAFSDHAGTIDRSHYYYFWTNTQSIPNQTYLDVNKEWKTSEDIDGTGFYVMAGEEYEVTFNWSPSDSTIESNENNSGWETMPYKIKFVEPQKSPGEVNTFLFIVLAIILIIIVVLIVLSKYMSSTKRKKSTRKNRKRR